MRGIDDDSGKACGVDHAFVEIEVPAAVLLGEQPALQAIVKPRHGAVQRQQLLVEEGAQALELVGVAQLLGIDHLVIGAGEDLVAEGLGVIEHGGVGPPRLGTPGHVARVGLPVETVGGGRVVVQRLLGERVLLGLLVGGKLGTLIAFGVGLFGFRGVGVGLAILALFATVAGGVEMVGKVERGKQVASEPAEGLLVEDELGHAVEHACRALLDEGAPEIDDGARLGRRGLAREPLAHQESERVLDRRLGAVGRLAEAAPLVALLDAGGEIGRHPLHALRPDRLDAGLLDRLEHGARLDARRRERSVQAWVVTGDGQRRGIGVTPDHGDLGFGWNARGLRDAGRLAGKPGRLAREHHLDAGVAGNGAGGKRHRPLERVERRLFASGERHCQLKATFAVDCGRSSPKERW